MSLKCGTQPEPTAARVSFQGQIPMKRPHVFAWHGGPGGQWGKPYYHLGQECEKAGVPRGSVRSPLSLSQSAVAQTRLNDRHKEKTLHVFGDPPSARSCVVSYNKDGLAMDSASHYTKVGSKHMCAPRPDHQHALHRNMTMPEIHPWSRRRSVLREHTPSYLNAAFSTSSDDIGRFYHSAVAPDVSRSPKDGVAIDSRAHHARGASKQRPAPLLRERTPSYFNAPFSRSSDEIGKMYQGPVVPDPGMFPKAKYDR